MKIHQLIYISVVVLLINGCSTQKIYHQKGSDQFSTPFNPNKALVIVESDVEFYETGLLGTNLYKGKMLVGYAKLVSGKTQLDLYNGQDWEFATYPGASIPFYSGDEPYGVHAYLLNPGTYAVIRCVFGAPEVDYCPEGYWTRNNTPAGIPHFTVSAGEIINTGKLHVVRKWGSGPSTYEVSIADNNIEAKDYLNKIWPEFSGELEYRPLQFTY